jgi:thiamine biosynthesis lipoprotein
MKRWISFLLALSFLCLAGCGAPTVGDVGTSAQIFAMDTIMNVTVFGETGEASVQAARTEITRLEQLLSRTRNDSQISTINAHAGDGVEVPVESDLAQLLLFAKSVQQDLPGCFDITIAPVMDAWGFTKEAYHVPTQSELDALLPLVNSENLLVDTEASTVQLAQAGMELDLGALAKGFAAGRVQAVLEAQGVTCAMLDLGGNITVLGTKEDGSSWRIAVKNPQDTSTYLGILSLQDETASTSGGYERYFEEDGVRYHHIIDPETGYPAQSGLLSVSVISADPLLADALSTALFVAGEEQALKFWRESDDFELVLCTQDNRVVVTEGLEERFQFKGEELGYTYETARR